ncbi:glycosyltransferase family 4 protein [Bacillus cereus]|uniref:glycosyltransferase family 4 protein n=1 Tax=Bacillus cereus TaxID=1396 RepID=UPI002AC2235D|nr:glycosyltransferase family 4 protein [Bacillus cereus]MDZ4476644.1 glycosyltransferase family 4 protein [Bacillus cereus]MDZ4496715.1 glycosyltransferase family 4 protein [Bacillus cereus]MDZ4518703.1 glycosyltransferase family 4 protein [Bacillus cereus]
MNKIKVLIISEALGGGVRRHLVDLLDGIDTSKFDVFMVYGPHRADNIFISSMEKLKKKGIKFFEVDSLINKISLKSDFRCTKELVKIIREINPDIVHCHSSKAGALGRIAAKICKVNKVFYTPHAYVFQNPKLSTIKKNIYYRIEKSLGKISTKNLHVSFGEERLALNAKVVPKEKSITIYNGIDHIRYESKSRSKDIIIGTVGRMDHQKNPWEFIEIAKSIVTNMDNVKFVYVGAGEYFDEISSYIKGEGLEDKIILKGFSSNPIEEMEKFDIFISTSLYEGLPYSLIEAMSCSLPVIATNIEGHDEIVLNEINGYLYELNNTKLANQTIESLIKDKSKLEEMSRESYKLYKEKFNLNTMVQSIMYTYEN